MKVQVENIFHSKSTIKLFAILLLMLTTLMAKASFILIPMDEKQTNHLKAF